MRGVFYECSAAEVTENPRAAARNGVFCRFCASRGVLWRYGDYEYGAIDSRDSSIAYSLVKKEQTLLTESYVVQSSAGNIVANIKMEHVLFTPGKLPKLTLTTQNGERFIVKKEIEQLEEIIVIEGEDLTISGNLFSDHFELLRKNICIATFTYHDSNKFIDIDINYELISILFAFAIEPVK